MTRQVRQSDGAKELISFIKSPLLSHIRICDIERLYGNIVEKTTLLLLSHIRICDSESKGNLENEWMTRAVTELFLGSRYA